MNGKISLALAMLGTTAAAIGVGSLAFYGPEAPPLPIPSEKASMSATAPAGAPRSAPSPTYLPAPPVELMAVPGGREAAPPKPGPTVTKTVEAGAEGPLKDAEDDGKLLDDVGSVLLPDGPHIPDEYLPFPGPEDGALPGGPDNPGASPVPDPSPLADADPVPTEAVPSEAVPAE
ncbi:hypothetical protein [Streptomyces sp. NPDC059479]|uniref:hypothetical protein n=1 Tax=Streptomyces sp. NPDC059479 TaxID=3346848 RepID=UPI0036B8475E